MMHPVGNVEMLTSNLRMILTSDALRESLIRGSKSLLLNMLTNDWANEFEHLIQRTHTQWEIKKLGY